MGKIKEIYMELIHQGLTPDGLSLSEAIEKLKYESEKDQRGAGLQQDQQSNSGETPQV